MKQKLAEQNPSTPQPVSSKDPEAAKIAQLARAGLIKTSEIPLLRQARLRQQKQPDMARLSKPHRDVLSKYYNAVSSAALASTQSVQAVRRNLMQQTEIEGEQLVVESAFKDERNPPPMIVLKRLGIRIFPDGRKVALYTNKQLGLTITIPFDEKLVIPGVQTEEIESDIMENIDQVVSYATQEQPKTTAKHMKFADGSKLKVSHGAAKAIHMVYDALNDENKKKYADMLTHPKGFEKAAHFALSKVTFKIGDK